MAGEKPPATHPSSFSPLPALWGLLRKSRARCPFQAPGIWRRRSRCHIPAWRVWRRIYPALERINPGLQAPAGTFSASSLWAGRRGQGECPPGRDVEKRIWPGSGAQLLGLLGCSSWVLWGCTIAYSRKNSTTSPLSASLGNSSMKLMRCQGNRKLVASGVI